MLISRCMLLHVVSYQKQFHPVIRNLFKQSCLHALRQTCNFPSNAAARFTKRSKNWVRTIYLTGVKNDDDVQENGTTDKLDIPEPEFDFEFLCDPNNTDHIRQNIINRKGVGNIYNVINLWKESQKDVDEVSVADYLQNHSTDVSTLCAKLNEEASKIPNKTHPDVPIGDESENKCVSLLGVKPDFTFKPKVAIKLGEKLGMVRVDNLGHTTGHRSYYFIDGFAKLEQALIKYTVDILLKKGFEIMSVPDVLHPAIIEGCGFPTRGNKTQVYKLAQYDVCLAGTGEMPIAGYFMNRRFTHDELPRRVCTMSRCYRAEAADTQDQGIYRVHQFTKVEMFVLGLNGSDTILEELVELQKEIFTDLGLHIRVLDMASQELGAAAYRKYDIEAWMPGSEIWGEISSASNCTDFQSRRLNMKYFTDEGNIHHIYTFNGTACAIPRTIMALVETNQNSDGSVSIPDVLVPYMGGLKQLVRSEHVPDANWIRFTNQYKKKMKENKKIK